jgi:flagellar assembly factor FliW
MMLAMADHAAFDPAEDEPVLRLVHPMPGFPAAEAFELVPVDESGVLARFRSVDHAGAQFLVVPAEPFFPSYAPEIDDDVAAELGIDAGSEVLVLLIVHAAETLAETTVNLRAPLLVEVASRRAVQVILEDADLALAAPLLG